MTSIFQSANLDARRESEKRLTAMIRRESLAARLAIWHSDGPILPPAPRTIRSPGNWASASCTARVGSLSRISSSTSFTGADTGDGFFTEVETLATETAKVTESTFDER
jgi:hypothetical protein